MDSGSPPENPNPSPSETNAAAPPEPDGSSPQENAAPSTSSSNPVDEIPAVAAAAAPENAAPDNAASESAAPSPSGRFDHEASTSGGGGGADEYEVNNRSWLTSPEASTSAAAQSPGLERTLSELAFSRFRNSMRVEARRSSARKSLLGRLGALPAPADHRPSMAHQLGQPQVFSPPPPQPPPWPLQHISFQGQGGEYPTVFSSDGGFSFGDQSPVIPLPVAVHPSISAYERFARAEFSEHIYGVGRLVWKRISVDELIQHSRVTLRAPLLRGLAAGPLSAKAAAVFAHLKGYMEDPIVPENVQPSDVKFLDTLRLMKAAIVQKLEPVREKLEPARIKMRLMLLKIDNVLRTKLFVPKTRLYHLQQILLTGIKYEDLRDEIFCQICKQTTLNPMSVSNARGWQAMAVCTGTFLPSLNFRPVLEEHLRQVADGIVGGALDPEKAKRMASYCLERLWKLLRVGSRHVVPSPEEILATENMHKTQVSVVVPGGNSQVVSLDSTTTGEELTAEIASRLGLTGVGFYGIFVVVNGVEKFAGTHGFVLESYTEWSIAPLPTLDEECQVFRKTRHFLVGQCAQCLYNMDPDSVLGKDLKHGIVVMDHLKEKEIDKEKSATEEAPVRPEETTNTGDMELQKLYADIHLLFKKNWFPVEDKSSADFSQIRAFEYAQAAHDVVQGSYVLEENDAIMLAALKLRAEHGSSADLDNHLTIKTVANYGPKEYVTGYEKAWRSAILKKVAGLPWEVDVNVCQEDYLAFLRSRCPLYGSSWFYVLPRACPQLPREVYLVLNFSGVYFVDVPLKEQLLHLKYVELCSWGYSDSSFSLVTGNLSYNMEFRLATRNGKEITRILQYFIKHEAAL